MGGGSLEKRLPNEGFTQKQFNIFFGPVSRRKRLQEHHDFLEVHFSKFIGPFDEKGDADVEMEFGESLLLSLAEG